MVRMTLLTVGVPSEVGIRDAVQTYVRRMRPPFWELEWQHVPEVSFQRGQEASAKAREGQRLLAKVSSKAFLVLLAVDGTQWDTDGLLGEVRSWRDSGRPLVFLVGGSLGVDASVVTRADRRWALSPLTFPHGLAQLLVAEQLYRLATMDIGHPYHKA
jgi:23S rRNA (pseudouridine1915-N3)-methyltransferase